MARCQRWWELPNPPLLPYPLMTPHSFSQKQTTSSGHSLVPRGLVPWEPISTDTQRVLREPPVLQPVLPRKHPNIFFISLASSSKMLTGNVTSVKPLLCCQRARLVPTRLTVSTSVLQSTSVTAQPHHLRFGRKTRPKRGMCFGSVRQKLILPTLPQQPFPLRSGWCWAKASMARAWPAHDTPTATHRGISHRWHRRPSLEDGTGTTGRLQSKPGHFS